MSSNDFAVFLFFFSLIALIYPYILYPFLLLILPGEKVSEIKYQEDRWPFINIVIPVYNGANIIGQKIKNIFSLDYPEDKYEIIVISDCSNDSTLEELRVFNDPRLKIIDLNKRSGKTAAENYALEYIKSDYVVFTDASVKLEKDALKSLISRLKDPRIGTVSTVDRIVAESGNSVGAGENAYVRLEMFIRARESNFGLLVGASGSCYACRRDLAQNIPVETTRDFYTPLLAREKGFFNVTAEDSICYISTQGEMINEFQRKIRTINNGISTLACHRNITNPFKYGLFSWALISHKIIRWLGGAFMVLLFLSNLYLVDFGFWGGLFLVQIITYSIFIYSLCGSKSIPLKIFRMTNFFIVTNIASLIAFINFLMKKQYTVWNPTKR